MNKIMLEKQLSGLGRSCYIDTCLMIDKYEIDNGMSKKEKEYQEDIDWLFETAKPSHKFVSSFVIGETVYVLIKKGIDFDSVIKIVSDMIDRYKLSILSPEFDLSASSLLIEKLGIVNTITDKDGHTETTYPKNVVKGLEMVQSRDEGFSFPSTISPDAVMINFFIDVAKNSKVYDKKKTNHNLAYQDAAVFYMAKVDGEPVSIITNDKDFIERSSSLHLNDKDTFTLSVSNIRDYRQYYEGDVMKSASGTHRHT
jgi:predicted nucleic acid-binding protein